MTDAWVLMALSLESTYIVDGDPLTFDFMASPHTVQKFARGGREARGQDRDRGGAHGANPRYTFFGKQVIPHEGILIATDPEGIVAASDALLDAIEGDLGVPPPDRKIGALTVQLAGKPAATADVGIESYSLILDHPNKRHLPYLINWIVWDRFLDGDGNPVRI